MQEAWRTGLAAAGVHTVLWPDETDIDLDDVAFIIAWDPPPELFTKVPWSGLFVKSDTCLLAE